MAEDEIEIVNSRHTVHVDSPPRSFNEIRSEPMEKQAEVMREEPVAHFRNSEVMRAERQPEMVEIHNHSDTTFNEPTYGRQQTRGERFMQSMRERTPAPLLKYMDEKRAERATYKEAFTKAKLNRIPEIGRAQGIDAANKQYAKKDTQWGKLFTPAPAAFPRHGGHRVGKRGRQRVQKLSKRDRQLLSGFRQSARGRAVPERRGMQHEQERHGFGKQMTHPLASLTQPRQQPMAGFGKEKAHPFGSLTQSHGSGMNFGTMRNPMGEMKRRKL